jgi:hypothetical protein
MQDASINYLLCSKFNNIIYHSILNTKLMHETSIPILLCNTSFNGSVQQPKQLDF